METDDKPFHCSACGQKFANNDHLERHKQKHQLTLKFGSLKAGETNVADQTPTPTRFLRNLEDEGLFQDLDNPFDQDFKQAAPQLSANKEATSSNNNIPQTNRATTEKVTVLPQQAITSERVEQKPRGQSQVVPHSTIVEQKSVPRVTQQSAPVSVLVRVPHHIPAAIPASIAAPNAPVPSALPVPGHFQQCVSSSSMPIPSIPTPAIMLSPTSSNPPPFTQSAKQRLKEQLRQHQQQQQNVQESHSSNNIISRAMTEAVDMVTENGFQSSQQLISGHRMIKEDDEDNGLDDDEHYMDTKRSSKRPRRNQEDLDPDERRRRFLERNRAAATRCREKRKIWVQQLEKKADDLADTNNQLQSEIGLLRSEVAQLKSLLLAHKDCPVTLAQRKLMQGADIINPAGRQGCDSNGVKSDNPTAEDVATSALTQMAHRATLELESLANS